MLGEPQGLVHPEGLGKLKNVIDLKRYRIRDLSACSIVPLTLLQCYEYLTKPNA
jgi:hypothetical protein